MLTLGLLALPFLAVACDLRLGAAPDRDSLPTDEPARPDEVLRISQDTNVGGWVVLPDSFGVWVAGGGTLSEIDQDTGEVRQRGRGTWDYDYVQLARYGEGTIFLASGRTLWEISARSGTVLQQVDLGRLGYVDAVLYTGSGTWVTASTAHGGVLARIDLDTGDVLDRFEVGQGSHQLVKSAGYLVVGSQDFERPSVLRVDPRTGATTPMSTGPGSIAAVGSRLWVASDGDVVCVDTLDLASCGQIHIPRAASLASDGARLWVLSSTGSTSSSIYEPDPDQPSTVTLLDGVTGQIVAGPLALPSITPATISAFDGRAWIGFHGDGRVIRIDYGLARCSVPC
jgi:hypothetical protein